MKHVFGIFTALIAAGLIIVIAQMIREGLYPLPAGIDFENKDAVSGWLLSLPQNAFIIITISHGLGAFATGLISSLVADNSRMTTGMVGLTIIFILVMIYLFTYPFQVWFVITDTVVTAVLGFIGVLIGSARYVS